MLLCVRSLLLLLLLPALALSAENEEMITRVFKLPSLYLAGQATCTDPTPGPRTFIPQTAKEALTAYGVQFSAGASANFNPMTELLTVHNTEPNLNKVEVFVYSMVTGPSTVAYSLTVIEGPGELIRQANAAASRMTNAAKELALLLGYAKNPGSTVRVVGDAFIETRSGQRVTSEAVCEYIQSSDLKMDAKSRCSVIPEALPLGLVLEVEPVLDPNGVTIDSTLSIKLHPAPPRERQVRITEPLTGNDAEFPSPIISGAHFVTGLTSSSGTTKLVGITKPFGTRAEHEDVLWAAFLTGTVRTVKQIPHSKPAAKPQTTPLPSGMKSAAFNVPDGLFEDLRYEPGICSFPSKPHRTSLLDWFATIGIVPVAGAVADQQDGVLQIINTPENIERISALIDECLTESRKTIAFTLHTVEAPAPFLRDLTHKAAPDSDQHKMWAAVEAAAARGDARFINSAFFETKSGTRVTHEAMREHRYLSDFGTNDKGMPELAFETRQVGSRFEAEPTMGIDGRTVDLNFAYELNPAPPRHRRAHFLDPASKKPFEAPVTDFHALKILCGSCMTKGGIKLVSLHKPTGLGETELLWATFLQCDAVTQIPKPRHSATNPTQDPKAIKDPKAWEIRTFHVPPDFISSSREISMPARRSIRTILEAVGIVFPEGAYASYDPVAPTMTVKNTNKNLDQVEDYVASVTKNAPATVAITTHIVQGPGPLLRRLVHQASSKSDHRAELDEVLAAVKAGTVQHLSNARIETKSGTRATTEQGLKSPSVIGVDINDKGEPVFMQENRNVGFNLELDPTIDAAGTTVELTLAPEYHTAPPLEHREHLTDTQGRRLEFPLTDYFTAKTTTGITIPSGSARLLSLYKPTGKPEFDKEDILQAIFITCDILRAGE